VINNGIDLSVFNPVQSDLRSRYKLENQFILLGVASVWDERKGYSYFLELAARLKPDETLVLVGLSKKQIKSLPPNIIGIARTTNTAELAEIYSSADLFVNPTLEDNFPTTNLEALACGTPIVTFNSGGSPECLDVACGFVVERGDLTRLVAAIAKIKKYSKAAYHAACRKRAVARYDKDVKLFEYVKLYEKTLKNKGVFI
jgi:glycosyltransferase involved in cell wall biosynthesis